MSWLVSLSAGEFPSARKVGLHMLIPQVVRLADRPMADYCAVAFLLGLFLLAGCGPATEVAGPAASGTVTLDGKPVTMGTLNFIPKIEGSSAFAVIDENGHFEINTAAGSAGIAPGEYQVTVSEWAVEPGSEGPDGKVSEEGVRLVSEKYTSEETSGLTVTVTEQGPNEFTLELQSDE